MEKFIYTPCVIKTATQPLTIIFGILVDLPFFHRHNSTKIYNEYTRTTE